MKGNGPGEGVEDLRAEIVGPDSMAERNSSFKIDDFNEAGDESDESRDGKDILERQRENQRKQGGGESRKEQQR